MNYRIKFFFRLVRNFLFSSANREFLIFLFFLCLSSIFWLFRTLNESYEKEFNIPVRLINVPKNVVLTGDLPSSFRITAKDKGFMIMTYMFGNTIKPVTIDFGSYANHNTGHGIIQTSDLVKQVLGQINGSTRITGYKPDKLEFYFNFGASKNVPIKLSGRIIPEQMYYLAKVRFWPDSVRVYATKEKLDSIKEIYTEPVNFDNLSDTVIFKTRLHHIKGVKCKPSIVKVGLYPDIFTEESIDIPIVGINMPAGKILRTFPSKVSVVFITGISIFKQLRPENFSVVVDYKDIAAHPSDKCDLYLRTFPHGISKVRLAIKQVDYLIEQE